MSSEVLAPEVRKHSLTANTAYEMVIVGAKHFSFQCRTAVDVLIANSESGFGAGDYFTLKSGQVCNSPEKISFSGSIWLKAASNVVVELLEWDAT